MKQRNEIFDLMKGIAVILMMLCHLKYKEGPIYQFVYSFHMPLFFIVAGMFSKKISAESSFAEFSRKNMKRLLLPFFVTMSILCIWGGIQSFFKNDSSYFLRHLFTMLTASADVWNSQWGLIYAGPMWFLIALFGTREIFYGLQYLCSRFSRYQDELILGISILLSILSVILYPHLPSLPFCIMQAFTALAFYAIGWYVNIHSQSWWRYGLCILVWFVALFYGEICLDSCIISYYPLSYIGACGGTFVIYLFCKWICKLSTFAHSFIRPLTGFLGWCGMYSLPILCMHQFEMHSDLYYSIMCRIPITCERAWGGVIAIFFAWVIIHIPYLKNVYK